MMLLKHFDSTLASASRIFLIEALNISEASASGRYEGYATAAPQKQAPVKHGFGGAKKKIEQGEGGMNPKLQQVVEMLLPSDQHTGPGGISTRENAKEFEQREKDYTEKKRAMQASWERDMQVKHLVQRAALRALPPDLRAKAEEPDLSEFPHDRHLLFDTAPESYRSKSELGTKPQKGRDKL